MCKCPGGLAMSGPCHSGRMEEQAPAVGGGRFPSLPWLERPPKLLVGCVHPGLEEFQPILQSKVRTALVQPGSCGRRTYRGLRAVPGPARVDWVILCNTQDSTSEVNAEVPADSKREVCITFLTQASLLCVFISVNSDHTGTSGPGQDTVDVLLPLCPATRR